MKLIYRDIKRGNPADMEAFHGACSQLRENGAQVLILGCTELSLIKKNHNLGPGYLDAMEVLAYQSLLRCGKPIQSRYRNLIT